MIKYIAAFLSAALLLFSVASAAEISGSGIVTASALNVREYPDMSAPVKTSLMSGERIQIITKTGQWFEILHGGNTYYVHSDYITDSRTAKNYQSEVQNTTTSILSAPQSEAGRQKAEAIVHLAKSFMGIPYLWGGETPQEGFDCSGLVYYVYGQFGVSLYRVAKDQIRNGVAVDLDCLMPGDIVLFWNRASYSEINHVGIYVGNGSFIHAPQTGDVVKITTLQSGYYANNLVAARRIFE